MYRRSRWSESDTEIYSEEHIKRVLTACSISVEGEVDSDFIVFCPYHNNFRTPAGEVSKTTGHFFCFGCHESRSFIDLVSKTTGRTYFEARRLINSKRTENNISNEVSALLEDKPDFVEFDKATIDRLHQQMLSSDRSRRYLNGRGISDDSIVNYQIGYSEAKDMITIPVHTPDGMCIGFVGRSIEGKDFKNTSGLKRGKTLFNLHRAKRFDKVFVVESSLDAMRIEQCGGHAVATLGSSISRTQIDLLKRYFSSIIVVPDNDDAGDAMREKLKAAFGSQMISAWVPEPHNDFGKMTDNEITEFIDVFDDELQFILNR